MNRRIDQKEGLGKAEFPRTFDDSHASDCLILVRNILPALESLTM